jgi:hypothetical protein
VQALRSGRLRSKGTYVLRALADYDSPDWTVQSQTPTIRLPERIWSWSSIQWQHSEVSVDFETIRYGTFGEFDEEPSEFREFRFECESVWREDYFEIAIETVQVDVKKLFSLFPGEPASDQPACNPGTLPAESGIPPYVPPYLEFMLRASRELGLEPDQRTSKNDIIHGLKRTWPEHLGKPTKAKLEAMATFLRRPEHETGGNFPARDKT